MQVPVKKYMRLASVGFATILVKYNNTLAVKYNGDGYDTAYQANP